MTNLDIPPPVDMTWVNSALAADDALKILGLTVDPGSQAMMLPFAESAGSLICLYLDRITPIPGSIPGTPPPALRNAHANVSAELWRRKDAPFGVLDAWSPDTIGVRITPDPLNGVRNMLDPYRSRWGLA